MLLLVTEKISLPVGFVFYKSDPVLKAWEKEDKRLRKKGVLKNYPTKNELAVELVEKFKSNFEAIRIRSVKADALYGTQSFMDQLFPIWNY